MMMRYSGLLLYDAIALMLHDVTALLLCVGMTAVIGCQGRSGCACRQAKKSPGAAQVAKGSERATPAETKHPAPAIASVIEEGAVLTKLAGGFKFTEGPATDAHGNVYFTDIPNNRILKWSVDGQLTTFREDSGGANGLYFDREGNLVACEGGRRRVTRIGVDGAVTVLAAEYEGKIFNSPNDLWVDPKGGIYFSDPRYGEREGMLLHEDIYYVPAGGGKPMCVINDLEKPNGMIGTAEGTLLYVADRQANVTYVYSIENDGRLTHKRLFCREGADGMTIDRAGNVYITREGVSIYRSTGEKIGVISVPEEPSNVCFGGRDRKILYITARTSLYSIRMKIGGY